jgi:hypothetical protein
MIVDKGLSNGSRYLPEALLEAQRDRQFTDLTKIKASSFARVGEKFEYGLGVWRECDPSTCPKRPIISSAGAFGFYPWYDEDNKYYAILGMVEGPGFSLKSYELVKLLRPEILRLLEKCEANRN